MKDSTKLRSFSNDSLQSQLNDMTMELAYKL